MTTQVIDADEEQMIKTTGTVWSKDNRPPIDNTKDIEALSSAYGKLVMLKNIHGAV